jgi:hypothetical protein
MSAKPSKKSGKKVSVPSVSAAALAPSAVPMPVSAPEQATAQTAWIDSTDPRKRTFGRIIFVALWIYVAALWLLALDQTFHWGIFGPDVPPVP